MLPLPRMGNPAARVSGERFMIVSDRGDRIEGHLKEIAAVSSQSLSRDAKLRGAAGIGVALARNAMGTEQCTLRVALNDGRAFTLVARDNDALTSTFIAFEDAVAAYQTTSSAQRLHAGETLTFGTNLSLSRDAIVHRGKMIRLVEITGYALNMYTLAIDRNHRLETKIDVAAPNFSTFLKVLDGLLPGKNLGATTHDEQPKIPWYAVSANTYQPGQASLRSRLAILGLFPLIGVLYCAAMLVPAWRGYSRGREAFEAFEPRRLYMQTVEAQLDARAVDLPRTCPELTSTSGDDVWLTMVQSGDRNSVRGVYGEPGKTHDLPMFSGEPTLSDAWSQAIVNGGRVYFQIPNTSRWVLWNEGSEDRTSQTTAARDKKVNYIVAETENEKLLCGGTLLSDSIYSTELTTALIEASRGRP